MLAHAAALVVALSLAAEGLALQSQQPELAQAGGELTSAGEAKGEWPWSRRRAPTEEPRAPAPAQNRVAVLVSGSVERLLLSPLLTNVVRPNALKGLQVDLFFRLTAPTKFTKSALSKLSGSSDPKIATLLQTADETSFNATVMDFICTYAESHLAASCQWDLETSDTLSLPPDATHRQIMTQTSPLDTTEGKEVITRWRSLSRLWTAARTKARETQEPYTAVLATREDDYWLAPRLIDIEDFQLDSMKVAVTPCVHSSGVNEKTVIMGHDAADVMLRIYQAWQKGDMRLEGTRTAEEAWFRLATESELNVKPEPMNAASASYTHSGLPCFQEGTFNLKQDDDYEQCFAESAEYSPITNLFRTFSCETMSPDFYDMLWPQQVTRLHQTLAALANFDKRSPIVLTVVSPGEVEATLSMLTSLQAVGEEASSLVIGTSLGICKSLSEGSGVSGNKCIAVQPAQDVRSSVFKHAILATVAAAGLSDRIVYASPSATFSRNLDSADPHKHVLFAQKSCGDTAANVTEIDSSVIHLSDAPEATEILMRAWEHMLAEDKLSHSEALAAAVQETEYAEVGLLSCDSYRVQSSAGTADADKVLSWEMPPGVAQNMRRQHKKANANAWVDRLRKQASNSTQRRERSATVGETQRRADWKKQADEWKGAWEKRIQELRNENGYNETAVREQRRLRRQWNKAHKTTHKKRVRYLPADEAAKVKAKDEAWEASQAKQREDDLAHADSRKESFQREVEKAQAAMEAGDDEEGDEEDSTEEAGAA